MQERLLQLQKDNTVIMDKEDLIIQMLQDIKNSQTAAIARMDVLAADHARLNSDVTTMRNGYEPYEVTQMLHWVKKKSTEEDSVHIDIKRSFINWIVPVLCTLIAVGVLVIY